MAKRNLFSNLFNAILTIVSVYVIFRVASGLFPWLANGIWDAPSLKACQGILEAALGGCFAVLTERWNQLVFGSSTHRSNIGGQLLLLYCCSYVWHLFYFQNYLESSWF